MYIDKPKAKIANNTNYHINDKIQETIEFPTAGTAIMLYE